MKILGRIAFSALFLLIIGVPLFLHLDELPIQVWDEARVMVNAQEFADSPSWLVPTFEGEPDMWSTKPPLMVWLVFGFSQIFGWGELALRLPSAIAGLLCCLSLVWISKKALDKYATGMLAALVLVTSLGFVTIHGTRTGDYDALLTLFIVLYSFSWYFWLQTQHRTYIIATFVFLSLAALTKSVAAFFPLPALLIFTIYEKRLKLSLKQPAFYSGLAIFLVSVLGYYLGRESVNPGYLNKILTEELLHSYTNTVHGHGNTPFYYMGLWFSRSYMPWMLFLPLATWLGWQAGGTERRLTQFCLTYILVLTFIISTAATKLNWYDMSFYPFAAIIMGIGLFRILSVLYHGLKGVLYRAFVLVAFVVMLLYLPYYTVLDRIWIDQEDLHKNTYWQLGRYLQQVHRNKPDYIGNELYYMYPDYHAHLMAYEHLLAQDDIKSDRVYMPDFKPGMLVAVQDITYQLQLEERTKWELVDQYETVKIYRLK